MLTVNQIRTKFLDFFALKGHTVVNSDSVVPKEDPTVLFTTAGMQQFKREFLGFTDEYTCATTSQKCIRTDDLSDVGRTDFHHTFFEMLGNFSFGNYFKEDAIQWAWEFLTQELNISKDRLCVSVYKDDIEATEIWLNVIKVDPKRIFYLGDKSNFWPSNAKKDGPNGPCGPCSEIFYDYELGSGHYPKDPDDEMGRFCEIWNLVFTQFNRKDGGELESLPNKNIDTGMGLERLTSVVQGVKNNFETSIFVPIIEAIAIRLPNLELINKRIIADHLRAICFGISDGVMPSNEGRGYVIKKLIIDIADKALDHVDRPIIYTFVDVVAQVMDAYPEIATKAQEISAIIKNVETAYISVRCERLPEFIEKFKSCKNDKDIGRLMFVYRDTYGLAIRTIENSLLQLQCDKKLIKRAFVHYDELMLEQQKKSRLGSNISKDVFMGLNVKLNVEKTKFVGYVDAEIDARVLALVKYNKEVKSVKEGDSIQVILDQTPFYAESGGQIGDNGYIYINNGRICITNTTKQDDIWFHQGIVESGSVKNNDDVKVMINVDRRLSIMRNHTATHILQYALIKVLGEHIQQQGSYVGEDRLRFDFTHYAKITDPQRKQIEDLVNMLVRSCDGVETKDLPIEEANKLEAKSFFAEKYGKRVRVVSIGNYSKEFCGGTHLGSTGQIGTFVITSESAIAQGVRRIEGRTGVGAIFFMDQNKEELEKTSKILKVSINDVSEKVKNNMDRIKELENKISQNQFVVIQNSLDDLIENAEELGGIKLIRKIFDSIDLNILRRISDALRKKSKTSVIVLGTKFKDKASVLVVSSDEAIEKGIKADELIKVIAPIIGGSGGGKSRMAQAGGRDVKNLEKAFKDIQSFFEQ